MSARHDGDVTNEDLAAQINDLREQQGQFVTKGEMSDAIAAVRGELTDAIAAIPRQTAIAILSEVTPSIQALVQDAIVSAGAETTHWGEAKFRDAIAEYDRSQEALEAHRWKREQLREQERAERREDMQAVLTGIYSGASRLQKAVLWAIPFLVFASSLIGLIGLIRAFGVWQWLP